MFFMQTNGQEIMELLPVLRRGHERWTGMMKWEAEQKGYSCNDCYLSMQNCHDKSICCEDETGLCDFFEEIPTERRTDENNNLYV